MRSETIIKKEDGTQYRISVDLFSDSFSDSKFTWRFSIVYREKGKRKWKHVPDTLHEYQFRELSMEDRVIHTENNYLRFVSKEEILQSKLELWESIKPTIS